MLIIFKKFFRHVPIVFYSIIAALLLALSVLVAPSAFIKSIWILALPVILAPFFEWLAHKYLLHRICDPIKQPKTFQYMVDLHYKHHWEPSNLETVFAPVSAAFFVFLIFSPMAYFFFDFQGFLLFEASVVSYFLFYEWIHLAHHVPAYKAKTRYGKNIRNAHSWHHYKNENFWWGVTNPIGDYIFGTFKKPKEVELSPSAKSLGDLQ